MTGGGSMGPEDPTVSEEDLKRWSRREAETKKAQEEFRTKDWSKDPDVLQRMNAKKQDIKTKATGGVAGGTWVNRSNKS